MGGYRIIKQSEYFIPFPESHPVGCDWDRINKPDVLSCSTLLAVLLYISALAGHCTVNNWTGKQSWVVVLYIMVGGFLLYVYCLDSLLLLLLETVVNCRRALAYCCRPAAVFPITSLCVMWRWSTKMETGPQNSFTHSFSHFTSENRKSCLTFTFSL